MAGSNHIIPVIGPLATSLEGINLFMKTIIDAKPWLAEPSILPIPWKLHDMLISPTRRLKIGVLWDDEVVKPHPPITRALREVVEKLRTIPNIDIIDWQPYKHEEGWKTIASLYFADGAADEKKALEESGEPWMPLSKHILENEYTKNHSIADLWYWQHRRDVYQAEYAERWNATVGSEGNGAVMDAILCPAGPGVAPLLDTGMLWNVFLCLFVKLI